MLFKTFVTAELSKAGITVDGHKPGDIQVLRPRVYRRTALQASLGFADSYADGDFLCNDLEQFFQKWMGYRQRCKEFRLLTTGKVPGAENHLEAWIHLQSFVRNQQTIKRSKRVGKRHYDIGNDLYRAMLGPTMAYSCGYWAGAKTLDHAQRNKYRIICEKLGLKKGMRVLEIGCGWGGFAAFAAKEYGVTVVGVSISQEQINNVKAEHKELCDSGALDLRFMDYREIPQTFKGEFDAIVSIGMFEHVGPRNYREYMRIAWLALKPGGMFLLHTIVGNGGIDPFTWYRIFPGGVLPLEQQILAGARGYLIKEHSDNFGFDYSLTLTAWWENFKSAWPELKKSGRYDDKFYRMWEFYLKCCIVSFRTRRIQLNQYVFTKGGVEGGYQWNRPVYAE